MRKTHTILSPQLSPIHFELLEQVFIDQGYDFRLMKEVGPRAVELGLRYANNDLCYPCIMTTGQIMEAVLEDPTYRDEEGNLLPIAVVMSQTGGGCRASNYGGVIRKALDDTGYGHVPVMLFSLSSVSTLKLISLWSIKQALYAILLGDVIMTCLYRARPYEVEKGASDELAASLITRLKRQLKTMTEEDLKRHANTIVHNFRNVLPEDPPKKRRPTVGIVGEILLKYHPDGNNRLVDQIEAGGCEAIVSPFVDFFLYCLSGPVFQREILGTSRIKSAFAKLLIREIEKLKAMVSAPFKKVEFFADIHWRSVYELADLARPHISLAQSMGEGWLMCAEMAELAEGGCSHIAVAQPFACLPNHAVAAGVVKSLQKIYPKLMVNVVNYDPGASDTNQRNRLQMVLNHALSAE